MYDEIKRIKAEQEKEHPYLKCQNCFGKDYLCKEYEPYSQANDNCVLYQMRLEEYGTVSKHYQKIGELERRIDDIDGYD